MNYEGVETFLFEKLKKELPKHLSYHSLAHVKDVLDSATQIARAENVTEEDLVLIKTAAIFHDSGFIYGAKDHEERSCMIAKEYLPHYKYTSGQVKQICGMIMATKLPQKPHNLLEEILADADLDYLGRNDFFTISDRLYSELAMYNLVNSEDDWNKLQINFFEQHHYFTKTTKSLRLKQKQHHLNILRKRLEH